MDMLKGKSVLLCVSGSIAAYKAAELARLLIQSGATVRVAMTPAATEFVGPITFEALTGGPVFVDVFATARGPVDQYGPAEPNRNGIQHIEMSKRPDLILIAPATADIIGRIACGYGDDVVTTSVLAAACPVAIAPAMNQRMWSNPIVQQNVKKLRDVGYHIAGPGTGDLACGEVGPGRMLEPTEIMRMVPRFLGGARPRIDLGGRKVLVTLGRTEETVDPVRVLTNRSSGKMGVAVAEAARDAGADVTIVAGPASVSMPAGVQTINVRTAAEMKEALEERFDGTDALVMVAAVADYKAATEKLHKMESGQKRASIDLEPTDDILLALKGRRKKQVVIGFAMETQAEEQRARKKLQEKGLDLIVVNNPLKEGAEIGGDTNLCTFIPRTGPMQQLPVLRKDRIGFEVVRQLEYLIKNPQGSHPPRVEGDEGGPRAGAPGAGAPGASAPGAAGGGRPRSRGGRRRPPRKKAPAGSPS